MANSESKALAVDVIARIDKLEKGMAKAQQVTAKSFTTMESRAKKFESSFKDIGKDSLIGLSKSAIGAAAGLVTVGAAIEGAKNALESFDEIGKQAKAAGLSAEDFQALAYAANLGGVATDEFAKALEVFNRNAGLAAVGQGDMYAKLKLLNPELLRNIEAAKSQSERVILVASAIDKAGSASEKAALATTLFGDSGTRMAEVFKGGSAALADTTRKARDLGLVVDNQTISSAESMNDAFTTASQVLDTQFKEILIELAPLLTSTATLAGNLAGAINGVVDAFKDTKDQSTAGLRSQLAGLDRELGIAGQLGLQGSANYGRLQQRKAEIQAELTRRDNEPHITIGGGKTTPPPVDPAAAARALAQAAAVQKLIDNLKFQNAEFGKSARQQAVDTAVRQAGTAATRAQRDHIAQLAGANYDLAAAQDKVNAQMGEMRDLARSVFSSIVSDISQGKDAATVLSDALSQIGDQLLQIGTDALFGGGGSGGFGLLGQLLNLPGRASGGPVTAGRPYIVGERRPEVFVPDVPGRIVPNVANLRMPQNAGSQAVQINYAPVIDAHGADSSAVARLERTMATDKANFEARVVKTLRGVKDGRYRVK